MQMTGLPGAAWRRQTGQRRHSWLPIRDFTLTGVRHRWTPSTVRHRARNGGIRRSIKILTATNTRDSNGFGRNTPFTITALIVFASVNLLLNAKETVIFEVVLAWWQVALSCFLLHSNCCGRSSCIFFLIKTPQLLCVWCSFSGQITFAWNDMCFRWDAFKSTVRFERSLTQNYTKAKEGRKEAAKKLLAHGNLLPPSTFHHATNRSGHWA